MWSILWGYKHYLNNWVLPVTCVSRPEGGCCYYHLKYLNRLSRAAFKTIRIAASLSPYFGSYYIQDRLEVFWLDCFWLWLSQRVHSRQRGTAAWLHIIPKTVQLHDGSNYIWQSYAFVWCCRVSNFNRDCLFSLSVLIVKSKLFIESPVL